MTKKKKYDPTHTIRDFATISTGLKINYQLLGATRDVPGASGSVDRLTRHTGTSYNLMGTGAMVGGSIGLIDSLKQLEHINKKKRR